MKVCIVIPAYNEANKISQVLQDLKGKGFDVVVVDDGSKDGCGEIAQKMGAILIRHEKNKGKGASLQDGFDYAVKENYDWVLTMDADGQHAASDIDQFVKKSEQFPKSIITGSRMGNCKEMPFVRLLTNRIMSGMISWICKQSIPDTQCGFRMISREVLKEIKVTSCTYEIETEVLIKASKKGFKIYSVPIKTIYGDETSKINPVVDTIRFMKYIFKELGNYRPPQ